MFSIILPIIITSSGFLANPNGLFEPIELSESLVIEAQYLPPGSTIQTEAMALSLEDFSILRAEVETATSGCDARIDSLRLIHEETLKDVQQRCKERNSHYKSELDLKIQENSRLTKSLKEAQSSARTQMWINVGIAITSGALLTVAFTR